MQCNKCGYESEQDFTVCSQCGAVQNEVVLEPTVAERFLHGTRDNLMLVICILQTVSCITSLITGSVELINILMTIFLWQIYVNGCAGTTDVKNMRNLSGTIYANYVIINVMCVMLSVLGILIGFLLEGFLMDDIYAELVNSLDLPADEAGLLDALLSVSSWVITGVILVVAAVAFAINFVGYRKIHRLAKNAYQSVRENNIHLIEDVNGAVKWMWVFAVLGAIGAVCSATDSFMAFLSGGCDAASIMIAAVLVDKYLLKNK